MTGNRWYDGVECVYQVNIGASYVFNQISPPMTVGENGDEWMCVGGLNMHRFTLL